MDRCRPVIAMWVFVAMAFCQVTRSVKMMDLGGIKLHTRSSLAMFRPRDWFRLRCAKAAKADCMRKGKVVLLNLGDGTSPASLCIERELGRGGEGAVYQASLFRPKTESSVNPTDAVKKAANLYCLRGLNRLRGKKEAREAAVRMAQRSEIAVKEEFGPTDALPTEADFLEVLNQKVPGPYVEYHGYDAGHNLMLMQYVPRDLFAVLHEHQRPKMSLSIVASWMEELLEGLVAMHEECWAHRDIKPGNLLVDCPTELDSSCKLLIADVGYGCKLKDWQCQRTAQARRIAPAIDGELDECGENWGYTPGYEPPEFQREDYDARKHDVFSVGIVLKEMLWKLPIELQRTLSFEPFINLAKRMTAPAPQERCFAPTCLAQWRADMASVAAAHATAARR